MSSIQVIQGLYGNIDITSVIKTVSEKELSVVNNYFEVVSGDQPMRVYIDLDGRLSKEQIHKEYLNQENLDKIHQDILRRLMEKLEDVSIMSSSSQASNKLSYRITYINEYCDNVEDLRILVEKSKFKEIKRILKDKIPVVLGSNTVNCLTVDMSAYRTHGKMRCVNAWKKPDDMTRINKLEVGNIIDTFIHHIPEDCKVWEIPEKFKAKTQPKESKREEKTEPSDYKNVEHALKHISTNRGNSFSEWIKVGLAIHSDFPDAVDLFDDFSKRCNGYKGKSDVMKQWKTFKSKEGGLTSKSIFKWLKEDNIKEYNELFQKNAFTFDDDFSTGKIADYFKMTYGHEFVYSNEKLYHFNGVFWDTDNKKQSFINNFIDTILLSNLLSQCSKNEIQFHESEKKKLDKAEQEEKIKEMKKNRTNVMTLRNYKSRGGLIEEIITKITNDKLEFNENRDLFAFNNKIFNTKVNSFVEPHPEQYISYTSGFDYDENYDEKYNDELDKIIDSIFPNKENKDFYVLLLDNYPL